MPNRFMPIGTGTDTNIMLAQINQNFAQLDAEAVTKQFKGNSGEVLTLGKTGDQTLGMKVTQTTTAGVNIAMQIGKYNSTRYGLIFYDANGIPVQLIGQAPDDGRIGQWIVRPGQNVITQLGG